MVYGISNLKMQQSIYTDGAYDEYAYSASYKKEGNPSLTQNISKLIKDVTTLISVGDSIVILLSFDRLFIHLWPRMAAQQSIL